MTTPPEFESQEGRLHPSAQAVIFASTQRRLEFLDEPFWVGYPAATAILQRLDRILSRPRVGRPEGLLVIGVPDNGKSHLLDYLKILNPPIPSDGIVTLRIPVVSIEAPVGASRADLFESLCEALHIPDLSRRPLSRLRGRIVHALRDAGVKVIVIDELHNLIAGGEMRKRIVIDDLKTISNILKIALVGAGTTRALQAIRLDDQYESRMPPVMLPPWELNRTYLGLLKAIERRLPLREASVLTDRNLAELIYAHSKKTIGHTVSLILDSARLALHEGQEKLTEDLVRRAGSGNLPWMKV